MNTAKKMLCVFASLAIGLSVFFPYISVLGGAFSVNLMDATEGLTIKEINDAYIILTIAGLAVLFSALGKYILSLIIGIASFGFFLLLNSMMTAAMNSAEEGYASLAKAMTQNGLGYYLLMIGSVLLVVFSIMGLVGKQKADSVSGDTKAYPNRYQAGNHSVSGISGTAAAGWGSGAAQGKTWTCVCGQTNSDKLTYCPFCRRTREQSSDAARSIILCPHCGARNNGKNLNCFACGRSLRDDAADEEKTGNRDEGSAQKPAVQTNMTENDKVIEMIRKLAELHDAGVLTDEEFENKKKELLSMISVNAAGQIS